jgi:hypothetical protein
VSNVVGADAGLSGLAESSEDTWREWSRLVLYKLDQYESLKQQVEDLRLKVNTLETANKMRSLWWGVIGAACATAVIQAFIWIANH